jgi:hypothetical protein
MDAELLLQIVISFKKLLFAQQPEIKKSSFINYYLTKWKGAVYIYITLMSV